MAARFGEPVSDAKEVSLRAGAIPDNTKASRSGVFGSGMNGLLAEQSYGRCCWRNSATNYAVTGNVSRRSRLLCNI